MEHPTPRERAADPDEERLGSWRAFKMEGALELQYRDKAGNPSTRRIIVRELRIGPGKTLLGGIDMANDGYRGFRADRIDRIVDAETGQVIDRNILDWLIGTAARQRRGRRKEAGQRARGGERPAKTGVARSRGFG